MSDRPFRVNVPSYISGELADYLEEHAMNNSRSRPYHPQIQSKIERWYRSLMNQILLENYYLPGDLADCIGQFVDYYNHERHHESLKNLIPADVFYGRDQSVLDRREKIKRRTFAMRRQMHYDNRVSNLNLMS